MQGVTFATYSLACLVSFGSSTKSDSVLEPSQRRGILLGRIRVHCAVKNT